MKEIDTSTYYKISSKLQEYLIVNYDDESIKGKRSRNRRILNIFTHLGFDPIKDTIIYNKYRELILMKEFLSICNLLIAYKYSRDQILVMNLMIKPRVTITIKEGLSPISLIDILKTKSLIK